MTSYYPDIKESEDGTDFFDFIYPKVGPQISLFWFLHGFCACFAYWLHKLYNYPLYVVYARDMRGCEFFIHAFCMQDNIFIDCRGPTKDIKDFIEEFDLTLDDGIRILGIDEDKFIKEYLGGDLSGIYMEAARNFVENNNGMYELKGV